VKSELYVGLMSGTSIDAIDCAVVRCSKSNIELLATAEHAIPETVRKEIAQLSHSGPDEIEKMGKLDRVIGALFAEASLSLLHGAGIAAQDIAAIGSHGQTIRHRPPSGGHTPKESFTLQIGDPNTIAELTGITTVADFRRRDIAAGGEGAPLAPAFHAAAFAKRGVNRAIVNIGGIANASILTGDQLHLGFDTGPGNTLLDHWIARHLGDRYDRDGAWSAEGRVSPELLSRLLEHPFLNKFGPRSTGKEAFNLHWLGQCCPDLDTPDPQNVQSTLAEYTAASIAKALVESGPTLNEVYICGGGAHNIDLMRRLTRHLKPTPLATTTALGMDPDWVEAAAFGWLAYRSVAGLAGNAPAGTGATGFRVLGGIYPGFPREP
jgi:anhydro-N-acetylmuramic acid kinase